MKKEHTNQISNKSVYDASEPFYVALSVGMIMTCVNLNFNVTGSVFLNIED